MLKAETNFSGFQSPYSKILENIENRKYEKYAFLKKKKMDF